MFAFGGYLQFLNSIYEFLTTQEGKNRFQNRRTRGQEDFNTQEMMLASRDEIMREETSIEEIKTYLKLNKPYGVFHGEISFDASLRRVFAEELLVLLTHKNVRIPINNKKRGYPTPHTVIC